MDQREAMKELDYGIMQATSAFIEAIGMMSENQQRLARGESIAYPYEAFLKLIEVNGLHHNALLGRWRGVA